MLTKIFLNNQDLRLQAFCHKNPDPKAPVVLIVVPSLDDVEGSSKESKIINVISDTFIKIGFSVLIMQNDKSDNQAQQKSIPSSSVYHVSFAIDWLEGYFKESSHFWLAAINDSCIVGSEIVMRRPEIENFLLVNPYSKDQDYDFLSPTPCSGIIFNDKNLKPIYENKCLELVNFLNSQNSNVIEFFGYIDSKLENFRESLSEYINIKLATRIYKPVKKKRRRRRRNDER